MRYDTPEIRIEEQPEGWGSVRANAFWGARIPYLPEYGGGREQTIGPEGLAAYEAWLRFVAAIAQLPSTPHTVFDLRLRSQPTPEGQTRITVALLGRATEVGGAGEGSRLRVRQAAQFGWHAVSGTLPPEYPLLPLSQDEVADWLNPYGTVVRVIEIRKRVVNLGGHPLKELSYRFRPAPVGMLQSCRALLHRHQPCLVSIGITPTELKPEERRKLEGALAATVAALPSLSQWSSRMRAELLQSEYHSLTADLLADLTGMEKTSPPPVGEALAADDTGTLAGPALTRLLSHLDPQIAAAVRIYSQLLSAAALLAVRISIAAPHEPAYEIAHALGAELTASPEDDGTPLLSGYQLVEDSGGELARHLRRATVAESEGSGRLAMLCTPHEAAAAFKLPLVCGSWIGIPTKPRNPFRPDSALWKSGDPLAEAQMGANRRLRLGRIVDDTYRYHDLPDYHVTLDDLTQHALIVGGTGSGKTTTGLHLVQQVRHLGDAGEEPVHVLLVDPVKTELRPFVRHPIDGREFLAFSVGSRFSPLYIDAFHVPDGVTPEQHLQILTSCFSAAFPMGGPLELLLARSLRDVYRDLYSEDLQTPLQPGTPRPETPEDMLSYIASKAAKRIESYRGDIRGNLTAAVQHRLEWLAEGVVGRAIVPRAGDRVLDIDTLLGNDVLIELRLLPGNEEKALVMALMLAMMGEHYASSIGARGGVADSGGRLRHLTWMDEAQRLFSAQGSASQDPEVANARGRVIELFVEMLSEMRSRGEGLIISTQLPSLLDPRVRKHPGMKIMHRLTPEDDRSVLGATMDLDEEQLRFVTRLPAGQAAVFRGQLPAAVLVQVEDIRQQWASRHAQGRNPTADDWLHATVVPDSEVGDHMLRVVRAKPFGSVVSVSTRFAQRDTPGRHDRKSIDDRLNEHEEAIPDVHKTKFAGWGEPVCLHCQERCRNRHAVERCREVLLERRGAIAGAMKRAAKTGDRTELHAVGWRILGAAGLVPTWSLVYCYMAYLASQRVGGSTSTNYEKTEFVREALRLVGEEMLHGSGPR